MKIEEAIRKMAYMRDGYQKAIDEKVNEEMDIDSNETGSWVTGTRKPFSRLIEFYKSIVEAFNMAIDALEKQMGKAPKGKKLDRVLGDNGIMQGACPSCGETVTGNWNGQYCGHCGQKLDWEEQANE